MITRKTHLGIASSLALFAAAGLALASTAALAQQQRERPAENNTSAQQTQPGPDTTRETPPPARQPTLDELLGLEPQRPDAPEAPEEPADPSRRDLDRRLSGEELSEQFQQAVALMGDTAERLSVARDTGIETQRLQDEIIRRLDMLIQSAERQQQQGGGSSSASSQQERDQQQQPARPQSGAAQQQSTGDGSQEADPPAAESPHMRADLPARGASWGNLPDRVRDALLQGNADQYSSIYQRWTEAYYRRLAEEGNR